MITKEALEVLRKQYNCWTTVSLDCPIQCEKCENDVNFADFLETLKTVLDAFDNYSELPNSSGDLIDRAEAQTELQFAARRYTLSHEANGEGRVVWSDNLISVTDAMNALRKVPSAQPDIIACGDCKNWIRHDRRCGYWNHGVRAIDWCSYAERITYE